MTLAPLLDELFPVSSGVRIIAEPGRYYSASAFTLAVNVYSKRTVLRSQMKEKEIADIVPTPGGSEELVGVHPTWLYYKLYRALHKTLACPLGNSHFSSTCLKLF